MNPQQAEQKSKQNEVKYYTFGEIKHVYAPQHGKGAEYRRKNLAKRGRLKVKRRKLVTE